MASPPQNAAQSPTWDVSAGPPAADGATGRALAPDLARGMMLLFIALANVSYHLWGRETGTATAHLLDGSALDVATQTIVRIAVDARSYPLFAFLFGYGMVQFYRSRRDRGLEEGVVRRMLRRRHWAMILFGLIHAALLFTGDILGIYGLAGLLLVWIFFRRRDKTLWIWVSIFGVLVAIFAALALVGGYLTLRYAPEEVFHQMAEGSIQSDTAGNESYLASIPHRLATWIVIGLGSLAGLSIPIAIILGWLAARHRLLEDTERHHSLLKKLAFIGIPIGWIGAVPSALPALGLLDVRSEVDWMFMGLNYLTGIATGVGYAAAFALIAARVKDSPPAIVTAIAAVGQRSLTFYLWQSVVFALLLSNWALGVGGEIGSAAAFGIALLTWAASIPMAAFLASRGKRGPAEVALRRLTYGRDGAVATPRR